MTSREWLAGFLEQGAQEPGPYAPDAASADAARRLRDRLAEPDGWAEPPAGLLDQLLADIDGERGALTGLRARRPSPGARPAGTADAGQGCAERPGQERPHCWPPPRS